MKGLYPMTTESLQRIGRALKEAKVRYLTVGGIAVIAHGYVRATLDLDLVIALESDNLLRGLKALEKIGYRSQLPVKLEDVVSPEKRKDWAEDKNMIVLQLVNDEMRDAPIDIFIQEPFDFSEQFAAALQFDIGNDIQIPVLCREGLIVMKKEAARRKDLLDVEFLEKSIEL